MRLNAFLAKAGVSSRRGADSLIKAGRVQVNGQPGQLNSKVSESDKILLDGQPLTKQKYRYILLHKPAGVVTTLSDEKDRRTVTDMVKIPQRVVPVGRLDLDTTGALILTNDGELAHQLMHPSFELDKVYEAEVQEKIKPKMLELLSKPIKLEDGLAALAKARKISSQKVELIIHEGRKHQVKRMLSAAGLTTKKLHRSKYGSLDLAGLRPGQWRDLTTSEVNRLKNPH